MTTINIDLDPIISKVKTEAVEQVTRSVENTASLIVRSLMNSGKHYNSKEGLGHEIIRKHVEDYVLSDKFLKKLDVIIDNVADEQMTEAVKILLQSKTRKVLFDATQTTGSE